jgi:hypothetical protein
MEEPSVYGYIMFIPDFIGTEAALHVAGKPLGLQE